MNYEGFAFPKTPIKAKRPSKRINPRRRDPRPGRLSTEEIGKVREQRYAEQGGRCLKCGKKVPLNGDIFTRGHLAHKRNKRMWGDGPENIKGIECPTCHLVIEHQYGPSGQKPCPKK